MNDLRMCYIARCLCGCGAIVATTLDEFDQREDTAVFVGDLIRGGHAVERLPVGAALMRECRKTALIKWPKLESVRALLGALSFGFELRQLPLAEGVAPSAARPFRIYKDGVTPANQILSAALAIAAANRGLVESDRMLDDGTIVYRLKPRASPKAKAGKVLE